MKDPHPMVGQARLRYLATIGIDRADWYDKALLEIYGICDKETWNPSKFIDTLAILSPQVAIRRNVRMALVYWGQGGVFFTNTLPNVKRSLQKYNDSGFIGGYKVPVFAKALRGDTTAVVLDTWMSKAILRVKSPSVSHFRRQATYTKATALVCKVAEQLRLSPRDCQAAIWSGIFREYGQNPQYFPITDEYERWLAYDRSFPLSGTIDIPPEQENVRDHDASFDVEELELELEFQNS